MWFCDGRMRLTGSRHEASMGIKLYTCNPAPTPSDCFDDPDITFGTTCQRYQYRLIIRADMHLAGRIDVVKFDDKNTIRLQMLINL